MRHRLISDGGEHMPDRGLPVTTTIRRFCELTGIGRSKLYVMLDAGDIASVHIGGRRLILMQSYLDLIDRLTSGQPNPGRAQK